MIGEDARHDWARALIARGREAGEVPPYGSLEWSALPEGDRRKVAACVIAAECWRNETDPATIRRDLENEISANRWLAERQDAEDWKRAAGKVVAIATARRRRPHEDNLRGVS